MFFYLQFIFITSFIFQNLCNIQIYFSISRDSRTRRGTFLLLFTLFSLTHVFKGSKHSLKGVKHMKPSLSIKISLKKISVTNWFFSFHRQHQAGIILHKIIYRSSDSGTEMGSRVIVGKIRWVPSDIHPWAVLLKVGRFNPASWSSGYLGGFRSTSGSLNVIPLETFSNPPNGVATL